MVVLDETLDAIRMTPPGPGMEEQASSMSHGPLPMKDEKVPRPPNPFILYRQHHHPLLKEAHPEMHNNEICKYLKLAYDDLADWLNSCDPR